jgi:hypothetical protein
MCDVAREGAAMASIQVGIAKQWWLGIAAALVIGAATPSSMMAQSCCRCDFGGQPSSCNPGVPDQAECEEVCVVFLNSTFGDFQTCPAGMVQVGCSMEPFCQIGCALPTPAAASVPTTSTAGTLVAVSILVALGGYTLSQRRAL